LLVIVMFALYINTQRTEMIVTANAIEISKYNDSIVRFKQELIDLKRVNEIQNETIENLDTLYTNLIRNNRTFLADSN